MTGLNDVLDQAISLHRSGNPAGAEPLYRRVLAEAPAMPDVHYFLGMSCLQQGKADAALRSLRTAVRMRPGQGEWMFNLGVAQRQVGNMADAAISFAAAAQAYPHTHPNHVGALAEQGAIYTALADFARAEPLLRQALALAPGDRSVAANLAACLYNRFAHANALADPGAVPALELAVKLAPDRLEMLERLGQAYLQTEQPAKARDCFADLLRRQPAHEGAGVGLADAQVALGLFDEAVVTAQTLLSRRADWPRALVALAAGLHGQGALSAARAALEQALVLEPGLLPALINLGTVLRDLGDDEATETCYRQALAADPENPIIHWQRAQARLIAGDMGEGWREYEWRWHVPGFPLAPDVAALPVWTGDIPPSGRLLIHAEQGHGDSLQFIRYVHLLHSAGLHLLVQVQPALVRLFHESLPDRVAVVALGTPVPADIAVRCPLMGLPLRLGTRTLATIPADVPYLHVPEDRAAMWRERLSALPSFKVGLVWAGDARAHDPRAAATDRRRSASLDMLAPLGTIPGITFISLQKGPAAAQAAADVTPFPLIDWTDQFGDFADTAALVAGLDLIIGVDTAVIHLAGALGRPVWVLSRFDGCWRWLRSRDDSPWYPSLRLFRQQRWGDWRPTIADLTDSLEFIVSDQHG